MGVTDTSLPTQNAPDVDLVLVVDFGAQYAQLIARRVREAGVFSEVVPSTMPLAEMLAKGPSAMILSGGPSSVYVDGAPQVDADLFTAQVPVFGICYGFQAMALALPATWRRYGLDADHDGRADPFSPADALFSAARYDCALYRRLHSLPGNHLSLTLAAYNAGPATVEKYRGVPPFDETRAYIARITALADQLASAHGQFPASASQVLG